VVCGGLSYFQLIAKSAKICCFCDYPSGPPIPARASPKPILRVFPCPESEKSLKALKSSEFGVKSEKSELKVVKNALFMHFFKTPKLTKMDKT
jgi:hypothetical protein